MNVPIQLKIAFKYLGLVEVPGGKTHPTIALWLKQMGAAWRDDETPWCGTFMHGVFTEAKLKPVAKAAAARSWSNLPTKLAGPAIGAIVVFWRDSPTSGKGHVGLVAGRDQFGNIMVIGGNQGDAVTIKPFTLNPKSTRVVGFYWPEGVERPLRTGIDTLPVVKSNGTLSSKES